MESTDLFEWTKLRSDTLSNDREAYHISARIPKVSTRKETLGNPILHGFAHPTSLLELGGTWPSQKDFLMNHKIMSQSHTVAGF